MQQAQEPSATPSPERPGAPSDSYISPGKAFLGLMLVVAAVVGAAILTRPDEPKVSAPPSSASDEDSGAEQVRLTEVEVLDTFNRLNTLALRIGRNRDLSLIDRVFTSNGPTARRARRAVSKLLDDRVIDKTRFETVRLKVLSVGATQATLRQVRRVFPCFIRESGENITRSRAVVRQVIKWTLSEQNGLWRLRDGVVMKDSVVGKQRGRCR